MTLHPIEKDESFANIDERFFKQPIFTDVELQNEKRL